MEGRSSEAVTSDVSSCKCHICCLVYHMVFFRRRAKHLLHHWSTMTLILALSVLLGTGSSLAHLRTVKSPTKILHDTSPSFDEERRLIVRGKVANPEEYSFFALTANDSYASTIDNVCGATLIHSDILVTAAHCHGFFNYGVRMYNDRSGNFNRKVRIVEQWRHPNFNLDNDNLNWDIMLMRLEEPVYDIKPVPVNNNENVPARNEILKSAGFGAPGYRAELTRTLMEGEFEYMMPNTCRERIDRYKVSGVDFGEEILCVGPTDERNSICLGDSGGPLLTQDGVLVGVTSWTVRCDSDQVPDGFARVSTVYDWVQDKICEVSVDRPSGCPTSPTFRPNTMVEMKLRFRHDFSPEDTTFAVRNRQTRAIEYAGPTYVVPDRVITSVWISKFFLPQGRYSFEVYDKEKNGLGETEMNAKVGFWELYAKYQEASSDYTLVASGDHLFDDQSITDFEIDSAPTISPQPTPYPTRQATSSPTNLPTRLPTSTPTVQPTMSSIPSQAPTTSMPSIAPTAAASASPTIVPTQFPTNAPSPRPSERPTLGLTNPPTVTPMPTSATPEPSFYPTEHPTLVPSSSPTLSLAPTTNETAVPIEPAVSIAEKRLTRDSPENFEVAGALLAGLVLVQGILLVRSRFFQDNTHWLSLFARSFARTPWPTFGNMASFADAIHGLRNWTGLSFHETASSRGISISFVLRAKRQVHGWWQKFSEHASVTSESVSDLSSRFAERLTEIRIQFNDWCLNSWDHVAGASHVYPFAAAQTFLSGWYQDAFVEDVGSENTSQTPGSPHARSASMTIGQEL